MTQIVFLLFEDLSQPEKSEDRYRVHIHFSPGVRCRDELAGFSEAKKTSPELLGRSHLVQRLPAHVIDPQCRCSHDSNQPLEHERLIQRQSDHSSTGAVCVYSGSIFSETEVQTTLTGHGTSPTKLRNGTSAWTRKGLASPPSPSSRELSFFKRSPKKEDYPKRKTSVPTRQEVLRCQMQLASFKIEENGKSHVVGGIEALKSSSLGKQG